MAPEGRQQRSTASTCLLSAFAYRAQNSLATCLGHCRGARSDLTSVPPPKVFDLEPRTYLTLDAQARSPNVDKPSAAVRLPGEQKEGCGETRGSIGCLLECQEISYYGGRVQPDPEAAQMIACVRSSLHRQVCSSVPMSLRPAERKFVY